MLGVSSGKNSGIPPTPPEYATFPDDFMMISASTGKKEGGKKM